MMNFIPIEETLSRIAKNATKQESLIGDPIIQTESTGTNEIILTDVDLAPKKITLKINPIALARPRFSKEGSVFDSQSKTKKLVAMLALSEIKKNKLFALSGPVAIWLVFSVKMPNSWSMKKRKEFQGKPCDKKPDLDNYVKFILDILNGLIYSDDRQITRLSCEKLWANSGMIEIWYKEIDR